MSVPVSLAGVTYAIPTEGDLDWGDTVTSWIQAASDEIDDLIAGGGGGGGGIDTVGAFSASGDAESASISGSTITFHPATATQPGGVSTTTQTFAGNKTFAGTIAASNFSGSHSGTSSGTNTGDQTSVTGNAGTATALQTARNIGGTSFNGSADIEPIQVGPDASNRLSFAAGDASLTAAGDAILGHGATFVSVGTGATQRIQFTDGGDAAWGGSESIFITANQEVFLQAGSFVQVEAADDVRINADVEVDADVHITGTLTVDTLIVGSGGEPDADATTAGIVNLAPQVLGDGPKEVEALDLENSASSNPSAGRVRLYTHSTRGKTRPVYRSPDSVRATEFSSHPGKKHVVWREAAGAGGSTVTLFGASGVVSGGTSTANVASTNIRTQMLRLGYDTTVGANNSNGWRFSDLIHWRGNAAGLGGFDATQRFGFRSLTPSDGRFFTGFRATVAQIGTTVDPSSLTDIVGVGKDSADGTLYFMHNDNAGSCTKVSTTLTLSTAEYYELNIYAAPNASEILISLEELGSGTVAVATLTTELPTATSFLAWHFHNNSGPTGGAAFQTDWTSTWIERDL